MATEFVNSADIACAIPASQTTKAPHFGSGSFSCISKTTAKTVDVTKKIISSNRNGQNLAGSGALVFEGELLEIPVWN